MNSDGSTQRKTTWYSSRNVLSGLLVCAECGSNYCHITRPNGEVVWWCADRVEKGKQSVCKYLPTITDIALKGMIYKELELLTYDDQIVQKNFSHALIETDAQISIVQVLHDQFHQMSSL